MKNTCFSGYTGISLSVCVQNQSPGVGIKTHSVTALVSLSKGKLDHPSMFFEL